MSLFTSRLFWNGDKAVEFVNDKIHQGMIAAGRRAVQLARTYVPVDTGQTRDSIGFTYRQSDMVLTLHADTRWAYFLEFGTRFMTPRPFLRPALLKASPWWASTAIQFQQIRAPGTMPMPLANARAIHQGNLMNRVIDRQFSSFTGRKAPRVEFLGRTATSTPNAVSKFGHGTKRIQNVSWKKILGKG